MLVQVLVFSWRSFLRCLDCVIYVFGRPVFIEPHGGNVLVLAWRQAVIWPFTRHTDISSTRRCGRVLRWESVFTDSSWVICRAWTHSFPLCCRDSGAGVSFCSLLTFLRGCAQSFHLNLQMHDQDKQYRHYYCWVYRAFLKSLLYPTDGEANSYGDQMNLDE